MIYLVAPDAVLYLITDTEPDQADVEALYARRSDLPRRDNLHQLFGWTPGPHSGRKKATDWQLLHDVKWAEFGGYYIPLVGSAKNALDIFNQYCGTCHILDSRFRNLYSGYRAFEGGWRLKEHPKEAPAAAFRVPDGGSLVGLRDSSGARSRSQAREATAAMDPQPMMVDIGSGLAAAGARGGMYSWDHSRGLLTHTISHPDFTKIRQEMTE